MKVVLPAPEEPTSAVRVPGRKAPEQLRSSCSICWPLHSLMRASDAGSSAMPCGGALLFHVDPIMHKRVQILQVHVTAKCLHANHVIPFVCHRSVRLLHSLQAAARSS